MVEDPWGDVEEPVVPPPPPDADFDHPEGLSANPGAPEALGRGHDSWHGTDNPSALVPDQPSASSRASPREQKKPDGVKRRLYRLWPGDNRFCCFGFCMTGAPSHMCTMGKFLRWLCRQCLGARCREATCSGTLGRIERCDSLNRPVCTAMSPANAFAWGCILVPCGVFFAFALPYYWTEVHFILPLAAVFFFFLTAGCLLAACFGDPGIIPRREVILATGSVERLRQELGYDLLGGEEADLTANNLPPRENGQKNVPSEMYFQGYRWCSTCKIIRPPRASHCIDCDNCVMRFDHHCPFVNNCVGQRNYLFFMGFTTSVCCLALIVIPSLLWYLIVVLGIEGKQENTNATMGDVDTDGLFLGVMITLAVVGGIVALAVIGLWAYHIFLICSGLTTKEHWKGKRVQDLPGYGEELTVFARRGPRLYNPRSLVRAIWRQDADAGTSQWELQAREVHQKV